MAFNFKSLGNIANAMSSAKDIVTGTSELATKVKGGTTPNDSDAQLENLPDGMYPERIEKLIRLVLAEGELDEDSIEMLERAAVKEGLDPDEVVFVAKKRLNQNTKQHRQNFHRLRNWQNRFQLSTQSSSQL